MTDNLSNEPDGAHADATPGTETTPNPVANQSEATTITVAKLEHRCKTYRVTTIARANIAVDEQYQPIIEFLLAHELSVEEQVIRDSLNFFTQQLPGPSQLLTKEHYD